MTAIPLTLDEGTDVRLTAVAPQPSEVLPSRRRQREHERSAGAEDRIPALAALDAAVEFVLVVRDGDGFRVFSEGELVAQDADGREVRGGRQGLEVGAALPILVGRHEDGEEVALDEVAPLSALESTEGDTDGLFESLLDLGEATVEAPPLIAAEDLGETNRVEGFVRGSASDDDAPADGLGEAPEDQIAVELVLEDGRRIAADHTVIFGRSPRSDDESAETIALDPTLTDISRNHLEIRVDGGSVLARDLASTNGTVLTRADQAPRLLPSDEPIRLLPGDSLNLGGSATVDVEPVA
jgi:hypothetical protein